MLHGGDMLKSKRNWSGQKKKSESIALAQNSQSILICDPAGIRTQDPILKRDVLYLLSY